MTNGRKQDGVSVSPKKNNWKTKVEIIQQYQ